MTTPNEQAQAAITHVQPAARKFIMDMALERARSQHSSSMALDARITQASYLQFAAAAVSATLDGAAGAGSASGIAVLATIAFVVGGATCFRGIRSDHHYAPGLPPDWWAAVVNYEPLSLAHAQIWAAGAMQDMMT